MYTQSGQLGFAVDSKKGGGSSFVYLAGQRIAEDHWNCGTNTHTVTYFHADALGSPVATTDAARNVLERTYYAPYGEALNRTVDGPGYTGHVMDAATGLVYAQQRYYDPVVGGFLSIDPVAADPSSGGNFNRYWYANNNPYKFTDPTGRAPKGCGDGSCEEPVRQQEPVREPDMRDVKALSLTMLMMVAEASPESFGNSGPIDTRLITATLMKGELEAVASTVPKASVAGVEGVATPSGMRSALRAAGFEGEGITNAAGTETGTLFKVPNMKMDVRVMDGGPNHPPRISTTRQGNPKQPVRPADGGNFGNIPRGEQRAGSHIVLGRDP